MDIELRCSSCRSYLTIAHVQSTGDEVTVTVAPHVCMSFKPKKKVIKGDLTFDSCEQCPYMRWDYEGSKKLCSYDVEEGGMLPIILRKNYQNFPDFCKLPYEGE